MSQDRKINRRTFLSRFAQGAVAFTSLSLVSQFPIQNSYRRFKTEIEDLQKSRLNIPPIPHLLDLKGVIHLHTTLSRDAKGTLEEAVAAAQDAGLQFLMTTDHNSRKIFTEGVHGRFNDVLVIRGAEMIKGGQALLAINVKEYINGHLMTIRQAIDEIKAQGGLAFVAHSWRFKEWEIEGINGMEVYDLADSFYGQAWKAPWVGLEVLTSWEEYSEEIFLTLLSRPDHYLSKWDRLIQKRKFVGIAGNDAHQNVRFFGRQLDPFSLDFKFVQTHLLASALEEGPLLEALRAGHAYSSFGLLADATGFQFFGERNGIVGIMGDDVPSAPGLVLVAQSPHVGRIQLKQSGKVVAEAFSRRLDYPVKEQGNYRVEVYLEIGKNQYPWIISNPIYVT